MRLITTGIETAFDPNTTPANGGVYPEGEGMHVMEHVFYQGAEPPWRDIQVSTAVKRTGAASLILPGDQTGDLDVWWPLSEVVGRTYYARIYFRKPYDTSFAGPILAFGTSNESLNLCQIIAQTDGTLKLLDRLGATIDVATAVLALNTWYRVELGFRANANGTAYIEARLDGVTFADANNYGSGYTAPGYMHVIEQNNDQAYFLDDVACNDSVTPAGFNPGDVGAQDSWPGEGRIYLMKPIADIADASWEHGEGGNVNLYQAIDNIPPGSDSIVNEAVGGSGEALDVRLQSYETVIGTGVGGIAVVQAFCVHNFDGFSNIPQGDIRLIEGPIDSGAATFSYGDGDDEDWRGARGPVVHRPQVAKAVQPVVRVRKTTGLVGGQASLAFVGAYVEISPGVPEVGGLSMLVGM